MDGTTDGTRDSSSSDVTHSSGAGPLDVSVPPSISRRRFTTLVGAGSLAVAGSAVASPHISTLRFGAKARVGSPPPHGSTTTTTSTTVAPTSTVVPEDRGKLTVDDHAPCAGNKLLVTATGFAKNVSVALEIDSAAYPLGVTTADSKGQVNTTVTLPKNGPLGPHKLVAVGLGADGTTLTLSTPINIKDQGNCRTGPEGSTVTTAHGDAVSGKDAGTGTSTGTAGTTSATSSGSGSLAFTGTDALGLALVGGAAAAAGRTMYGIARKRRGEDLDDVDDVGRG